MKRPAETSGSDPSGTDAEALDELLRHARDDGFTPQETEELWSRLGAVVGMASATNGPPAGSPAAKAASAWSAKTIAVLALGGAIAAGGLAASGSTRLAWHRLVPTSAIAPGRAVGNDREPPPLAVESGGTGAAGVPPNAGVQVPGSMTVSAPAPTSAPRGFAPRRQLPKGAQPPASGNANAGAESPEAAEALLGSALKAAQPPPTASANAGAASPEAAEAPLAAAPKSAMPQSQRGDPSVNEGALLLRARRELGSNPTETLNLTEEHARLFPAGTLVPEREVLAIEALAQLGRTSDARARVAEFRARFPYSPHLARLESMLGR